MTSPHAQSTIGKIARCLLHPIRSVRAWRWRRARSRNEKALRGYRMPVQVCPRGCHHRELARRDLLVRTRLWGRAAIHASFTFETTNCPECGVRLSRNCARCKEPIYAPVVDLCEFCGLLQPWASERRAGVERASIRLWHPDSSNAHDPAEPLYRSSQDKGDLWAIDGDVTRLAVDAVVSNDDVDGQMWAQVARAIKKAAGEGVERLAQEGKPFKLGDAWVTTAGGLTQMRNIIHVASMSRYGQSTIESVRESLVSALDLATKRGFKSIGIAAIGSGPASIHPAKWSEVFVRTALDHLNSEREVDGKPAPPLSIVLALFEPADFSAALTGLRETVYETWVEMGRPAEGEPDWKPSGQLRSAPD